MAASVTNAITAAVHGQLNLASIDIGATISDYGPALALLGVIFTLIVNAKRGSLERRQTNHARALAAVADYREMPFLIRRRRHDDLPGERARLSARFADVQAELATCETLIRADTDENVRLKYRELVTALRTHAGTQAQLAWNTKPITTDAEMSMPDVNDALAEINDAQRACENAMSKSRPLLFRLLPCLR